VSACLPDEREPVRSRRSVRRALIGVGGSVVALVAGATLPAQSLSDVALEARGGGAMGSFEPAAADASWGQRPAVALLLHYRVGPMLSVFGGYSRASFGCEGGFCEGAEVRFTSRGWDTGIQLRGPRGLWGRGGLALHGFDLPATADGTLRLRSNRSLGAHLGAGYGFALPAGLTVSPGLRYTRYRARFPDQGGSDRVDYLVADVGLTVTF
jgi:hypothetical protein